MKYISILALIIISTQAYSQNWSPIQTNEKINYQHSDSNYISHTIWIDNFDISGTDTTFFLNKIVKDHPTDIDKALRNQPLFLYSAMIRHENGVYHFADPGYYILYSLAAINDSWVFDLDENLVAQVVLIEQEEIFGIMDSVKTISLSNGSEIKLSKGFGIIQFPDFENGGYFELVGIQDSEYGISIPDFWNIYNFEVGDVFQTSESNHQMQGTTYRTRKFTINSKEVLNNAYQYNISGILYKSWYGPGSNGEESELYSDVLNITYSEDHPSNIFNNEIYLLPNSGSGYGTDRVFTFAKIFTDPEYGIIVKKLGAKDESYAPFSEDVFYELDENSDTLYKYQSVSLIGNPCGLMGVGYGNSIGDLFKSDGCFEYWQKRSFTGCINNGDTIGTITPDSLLLVGINSIIKTKIDIVLSPNPVIEEMTITFLSLNEINNSTIEIMTAAGQPIKSFHLNNKKSIISLSGLPNGIFIYNIKSGNHILKRGKFVKQ